MVSDSQRDRLFDYLDGRLDDAERIEFEQQLEADPELRKAWLAVREWQSAGDDWEDVPVPAWSRLRGVTTGSKTGFSGLLGWLSLASSATAILLVVFQAQFTVAENGFSLRFGPDTGGITEAQLERRLVTLERSRIENLNERLDLVEKKSQAMNRQLLAAALEYNRIERQDDMRAMAASWSLARSTDQLRVEDLRDDQFDDRMAIRQLYTRLPDMR